MKVKADTIPHWNPDVAPLDHSYKVVEYQPGKELVYEKTLFPLEVLKHWREKSQEKEGFANFMQILGIVSFACIGILLILILFKYETRPWLKKNYQQKMKPPPPPQIFVLFVPGFCYFFLLCTSVSSKKEKWTFDLEKGSFKIENEDGITRQKLEQVKKILVSQFGLRDNTWDERLLPSKPYGYSCNIILVFASSNRELTVAVMRGLVEKQESLKGGLSFAKTIRGNSKLPMEFEFAEDG